MVQLYGPRRVGHPKVFFPDSELESDTSEEVAQKRKTKTTKKVAMTKNQSKVHMMMIVTIKIILESGELTMMVATKMMDVALVAGR